MKERKETADIEKQAALFGILADPTRLRLLQLLSRQQEPNALCVNALARRLEITQSAVSQHLRVLKAAGLVKGERRGYRVHYFINKEALIQVHKEISRALPVKKVERRSGKSGGTG
jgi:DNA-binding transcriptional ArsR family regulator